MTAVLRHVKGVPLRRLLPPLRHAVILSVLAIGGLVVRRLLTNQPFWMGWRMAFLAVYVGEAVLSISWSMDRSRSMVSGL